MNKELARYFVKLIAEDLQFSFNGMGIPSYSCEWLENQLIQGNYDKVEEFIKKRYDEHENASKKKRKFRAMTNGEFCEKWQKKHKYCKPHGKLICPFLFSRNCSEKNKPYKTKDEKYILREVSE